MTDKLITIANYSDSLQAELSKAALENEGIASVIIEDVTHNLFGFATDKIKLQVKQSDAEKALEILRTETERE
jgi:hypothetical protein